MGKLSTALALATFAVALAITSGIETVILIAAMGIALFVFIPFALKTAKRNLRRR
jgi:hypothetical protein